MKLFKEFFYKYYYKNKIEKDWYNEVWNCKFPVDSLYFLSIEDKVWLSQFKSKNYVPVPDIFDVYGSKLITLKMICDHNRGTYGNQ